MATGTFPKISGGDPQIFLTAVMRTASGSFATPNNEINGYDNRYFSYSSTPDRHWTCLKAGTYLIKYAVQSAFGSGETTRNTSTIRVLINNSYGSRTLTSTTSSSTMENGNATVTLSVGDEISVNQKVNGSNTLPVCYSCIQIVKAS